MKKGLINLVSRITKQSLKLVAEASQSAAITLTFPGSLPTSTRALTVDASGNMGYANTGSVTSVGLSTSQSAIFEIGNSPITGSGSIAISLKDVSANSFLGGPTSGGDASPAFRALAFADISSFVGVGAGRVAAGDDSRFHSRNADTGTVSPTFQIGSAGPLVKNNSETIELRNAADSAFVDLRVKDLYVQGQQFVSNTTVIEYDDAILRLNKDFAGASPTENGGIEIERGTQTNAAALYDEATDRWQVGLLGTMQNVARFVEGQFNNTNLVAGKYQFTHNLGSLAVQVHVIDNLLEGIEIPELKAINVNTIELDLSSFGNIGTTNWRISVVG